MTRQYEGRQNRTVVIIDADNFKKTLGKIDLRLDNLKAFIHYCLDAKDVLTRFSNREGLIFDPVVYIVSKMVKEEVRIEQIEKLNKLKNDNRGLIKLSVVDPKTPDMGRWTSCTDSEVSSFIAIALYDKNVDKIVVVSGDGDFLRPLERIGITGKKIDMVSVRGCASGKLMDFVTLHQGRVVIINDKVPGLVKIERHRKSGSSEKRCFKESMNGGYVKKRKWKK